MVPRAISEVSLDDVIFDWSLSCFACQLSILPDFLLSLYSLLNVCIVNHRSATLSYFYREEWGANAVMVCFGAALAQACRNEKIEEKVLDENPVVVRAVQLVKGRLDLVVYQLNTMDLKSQNRNIVWIEPGLFLLLYCFLFLFVMIF